MVYSRPARRPSFKPDLSLVLMITLIVLLWVAGGASQANVLGQAVVRAGCWVLLITAVVIGPRPTVAGAKPVLLLLAATIALPLLQLIPLPPAWWQALPGRDILLVPREVAPWRPWTMTPGATRNALASLIVPTTMFVILWQASDRVYRWMPTVLLVMIGAAMFLGLLQVSGVWIDSPLLNDTPGTVGGIFANRNHFALLLAIGCLIAPVWAFADSGALRSRGLLAIGFIVLLVLTTLATGSRSGMLLSGLALTLALLLTGRHLRQRLADGPAWVVLAYIAGVVLVISGFIAASFYADRAQAIDRLIALASGEDMRSRALPTVLSMIATYFPFGSGFGGFDPVFRIHEPFDLLKPTYFNQAHDDYLGIVLDGGVAGVMVLTAGMTWWLVATFRIWRRASSTDIVLGRLGSAIILLVLVASLTDYPARTPTIMAFLVVAAMWLARANGQTPQEALP